MSSSNAHKGRLKGLYAITDEKLITEQEFSKAIELVLQGGARIIQYRDKSKNPQKRLQQANKLCALCEQYQAVSIINDDIELAKAVNADGLHIGKDDISLTKARHTLGHNAIIGVSCYNDLDRAIAAENNNADYVAFGAIFSSTTKPGADVAGLDIIAKAKQQLSIPVCTIGGITQENIQQVVQQGADMVAVISDIFFTDDIKKSTTALNQFFK